MRKVWISVSLGLMLLAGFVGEATAWAPPPVRAAAVDSVGGCGWDQEFGTAAQTDCEALLAQLKST